MKKLLFIVLSVTVLFGQQGEYVRKSISSLESVWFQPGSLGGLTFDAMTFDKFIDSYIEIDRFDYNLLPDTLLENFRQEANSIEEVSADALSAVLESTVTDKIIQILNDPRVRKQRGKDLKDESDSQMFAATKAKSLGLTTDELETLMNSAYIYLPYIESAEKETGDKSLTITIKGGIIWWKLKVNSEGEASVSKVLMATTSAIGSLDPNAKSPLTGQPKYSEFRFGDEKWATTPEQYAQNDAMLAFCKNLGVKTKEINDFKLSAQIVEVDGISYGFGLGHKEGIFLDDGFHIVEMEENAEGDEIAVKRGFVRVTKTGDNANDPNDFTYATQLLGDKVSEGTLVMEHPRLGMDAKFTLGMVAGSSILPYHTFTLTDWDGVLTEESTSQIVGNLNIAYNVAPIIGVSQTFLDLDIGFGLPIAEYEEDSGAIAYVISSYLGANKKFGGRVYAAAGASVGLDMLRISYTFAETIQTIEFSNFGFKVYGEAGYMLNADLSVIASAGYKMGFVKDFDDLELGGIMVNLGASYALGELPINIFGFLDPYKKY